MNQAAQLLGIELPLLSARSAVMRVASAERVEDAKKSVICRFEKQLSFDSDDGTASTVSYDESFSDSFSSQVTFAPTVVSEVHFRPKTTLSEKSQLYYTDREYRRFRRDYFEFKLRGESVVYFADEIVSAVHEYSQNGEKSDLYYDETDLRRFLDDFVSSLNDSCK